MIDPDRLPVEASATDRDVRILNLLNRNHRRGAEAFAVALGAALSAEGHDVTTVALAKASSGPTFAVEALTPAGAGLARMITPLRRIARGRDVVVGHGSDTLLAGVVGLAGTGTPFVYRVIGDPEYWTNSRPRQMRVRFALHRTTAVAVYYEAAAETLRRRYQLPADKVRVIPKGIDVGSITVPSRADRDAARRSLGIDTDTPVVLALGALTPEKNVAQVIDAVTHLERVTLLIAGSGPCRADLERRAGALGITDRVLFLGGVEDPAPALAAADVVALTSRTEGVPTVALEAALSARPMVATDVGGVSTVVKNGETGFLVPVDDVAATAAALTRSFAARDRLGAAARRTCEHDFALDAVARQWARLLEEVAS